MSQKLPSTIDNLVEIKENPYNLFSALKERSSMLNIFKGYGPPDLCYLLREEKGTFFSARRKGGFFHHVYGANTSSPGTILEYIKNTIAQGSNEYSYSHS